MTEEKNEIIEQEKVSKQVPIEWIMPVEVITPFATNMLVQVIENEFKISFFEIKPAMRFSQSDPFPSKVKALCIASVIVSADRLPKFIQVLQSQLDTYNSQKQTKVTPP